MLTVVMVVVLFAAGDAFHPGPRRNDHGSHAASGRPSGLHPVSLGRTTLSFSDRVKVVSLHDVLRISLDDVVTLFGC